MPLVKLQFRPGIYKESTNYANAGGWFDCNLMRFRNGNPEPIGGWVPYSVTGQILLGTCRSLFSWSSLAGALYLGAGTESKYYAITGNNYTDITPIREVSNLTDPFTTVNASSIVTVTDAVNGSAVGDYVTFSGATGFNGLTAGNLNREFQIQTIIDANNYTIDTGIAASGNGNGGGSVTATYQINIGQNNASGGTGWGAGPWSRGTWGSAYTTTTSTSNLRLWTERNYGEDLIFAPRYGSMYYWDLSVGGPGVAIQDLAGANLVPDTVIEVTVSNERHVIAFGAIPESGAAFDPMIIRFSSSENYLEWETRTDDSAGELRLTDGSTFVTHYQTRQEIVIWTDTSLSVMTYAGAPFYYGLQIIGRNVNIAGPKAKVGVGDVVYWMGKNRFYRYDGRITPMPCAVEDFIFRNINTTQLAKVCAGSNSTFGEVIWFYPSADAMENDRYVIYNYLADIWYIGALSRTAWIDADVFSSPLSTDATSTIFYQDVGYSDGSTTPPTALNPYIESSPFELDQGDSFGFISRVIPDLTFRNTSVPSPTALMTIEMRDWPGGSLAQENTKSVIQSQSVPIEIFTDEVFMRLRGRSAVFRMESDQLDVTWRLGTPRIDVRPDGRR